MLHSDKPFRSRLSVRHFVMALAAALVLNGCGASFDSTKNTIHRALQVSDYEGLARSYLDENGNPLYDTSDLLEMLIAAKAFHDAGYWKLSYRAFARAERKLLWKTDTVDTPAEFAQVVAKVLINDTVAPYGGNIFEGVLINYYQALNSMMMGDEDDARVAFNRAGVRQDNAETQLGDLEQVSAAAGQEANQRVQDGFEAQSLADLNRAARREAFKELTPRAEARNNAVDVASLVFRMASTARADASKVDGLADIARASARTPLALDLVERAARVGEKAQGQVFIIYEDGIGPSFAEQRLDVWINGNQQDASTVSYAGIALPVFVPGRPGPGTLIARAGGRKVATVPLAHIGSLAGREFLARFDAVVARALVSAFLKVVGQSIVNKALSQNSGDGDNDAGKRAASVIVSTLTGIFTRNVLTRADTRSWANLPRSIQLAVVPRPMDGILRLSAGTSATLRMSLPEMPDHGNVLILARAAGENGKLIAYVSHLPGSCRADSFNRSSGERRTGNRSGERETGSAGSRPCGITQTHAGGRESRSSRESSSAPDQGESR